MKEEQFIIVAQLREERNKIKNELKIWEKELTKPSKLGYLQGWNNFNPADLKTSIPIEIFDGFRMASMNALKLKIAWINKEIEAI